MICMALPLVANFLNRYYVNIYYLFCQILSLKLEEVNDFKVAWNVFEGQGIVSPYSSILIIYIAAKAIKASSAINGILPIKHVFRSASKIFKGV